MGFDLAPDKAGAALGDSDGVMCAAGDLCDWVVGTL